MKSVRTEAVGHGLLADFDAHGNPIGLELTAPTRVSLEQLNAVLERLGAMPLGHEDLAPLRAA
ncbi:MAG: hypothetical protein WKG32_21375 [Gemmatimonadaceae bacterium]